MSLERWSVRTKSGGSGRRLLRVSLLAALSAPAWGAPPVAPAPAKARAAVHPAAATPPQEAVARMLALVLRAPEVRSRVLITRSDPFGGPGERSAGRIWFLPGRGLRFRSEEKDGEDIVVDREKRTFLVYRPGEEVVYRADWERAPARMRRLIMEPERVMDADLQAARERRLVGGVWREGYRLRRASLGDSLPSVSVWLAADPQTGLPRWISAGGDQDSMDVEFRAMVILREAAPRDLALDLPRNVRTEPLDPRDLLPGGESR